MRRFVGCGREEIGVGLGGEGGGDGLGVAEGEQARADGAGGGVAGVLGDGAWAGEGVGEAVVAEDAGDLFDEVDGALEIEAPGGQGDFKVGFGEGSAFVSGVVRGVAEGGVVKQGGNVGSRASEGIAR